jgi:hypothetical protein
MTAISAIWGMIQGWVHQNATQCVSVVIPWQRTDVDNEPAALVPFQSYVRLWLTDMFLSANRQWFQDRYPAVHTSIGLKFGADTVKISHVTDGTGQVGPGHFVDYALTDLIPFSGGTVEVQSGLLALKGTNYLKGTIGILKDFSGLVAAPLTQTLEVAEKVSSGVQSLLGDGAGTIALGFHQQFMATDGGKGGNGGNVLRPGYVAVIAATSKEIDVSKLFVSGSKLRYGKDLDTAKPLEGYDYMLLRIEGRSERDNWRMRNIEEPLNQAIDATVRGEQEKAKQYLTATLAVIWQSPDLAVQDRRRVADAIKAELAVIAGEPLGAVNQERRSLEDIVKARVTVAEARKAGALHFSDVLVP